MKKIIKFLAITAQLAALTLSFSAGGYAQQTAESGFDFRRTNWGMTKKEVRVTEFGDISEDTNLLVSEDVVGGDMRALVAYVFADNKLVKGKYLFVEKHGDKNDYILDYERVRETLALKYGPPKSDEETWGDGKHKGDTEKRGLAVSLGHLAYKSKWQTKTTEIELVLYGNKQGIVFGVIYSSRKFGHPEDKVKSGEK